MPRSCREGRTFGLALIQGRGGRDGKLAKRSITSWSRRPPRFQVARDTANDHRGSTGLPVCRGDPDERPSRPRSDVLIGPNCGAPLQAAADRRTVRVRVLPKRRRWIHVRDDRPPRAHVGPPVSGKKGAQPRVAWVGPGPGVTEHAAPAGDGPAPSPRRSSRTSPRTFPGLRAVAALHPGAASDGRLQGVGVRDAHGRLADARLAVGDEGIAVRQARDLETVGSKLLTNPNPSR